MQPDSANTSQPNPVGDLTPTTDPTQIAESVSGLSTTMMLALTSEPNTGVGVISEDGQIMYINDQAAKIFHGHNACSTDYVGRNWRDHMPEDWIEERLKLFQTVKIHDKPVLMRSVWRDFQHFTWISLIESEPVEKSDSDEPCKPQPVLFLTITRRIASDDEAEDIMPRKKFEEVESGVIHLNKLDVLSPRELEVLALLGQGLNTTEVARVLHRSENTIDNHRTSIYNKLNIRDRVQLAEIARRAGLKINDAAKSRV
ncbi:MAG: LuxR C-terminal-related transcriptional regulator [Phycisphaerales bacterium]